MPEDFYEGDLRGGTIMAVHGQLMNRLDMQYREYGDAEPYGADALVPLL